MLRGGGVIVKTMRSTPSPGDIVATAAQYKKGDARRGISPDGFDEVWAVFDWDERTANVTSARRAANQTSVAVALSNPSFEVWLVWHFQEYMKIGCSASEVERDLRAAWPRYRKGADADMKCLDRERFEVARDRAVGADRIHEVEGRPYPENRPSSGVHVLIEHLVTVSGEAGGPLG